MVFLFLYSFTYGFLLSEWFKIGQEFWDGVCFAYTRRLFFLCCRLVTTMMKQFARKILIDAFFG
jgi:hypothetical protein